jgi:hypothetical protein
MMIIAITIILCFITTISVVWSREIRERKTSTNSNTVELDDGSRVTVNSVSGCGTHVYVNMPGKRNTISIDCGVEIKSNSGKSKLGNHIFLTNMSADHISALFCSILNARRFGATYNIYVPPSTDNSIVKKFIATCDMFESVDTDTFNIGRLDKQWKFTFLKHNIVLKEAVGNMIVSTDNIIVRAFYSMRNTESCAYVIYTIVSGAKKYIAACPNIDVGNLVFKPVATFGGDTMFDIWKCNTCICQSKNVFASCLRYTGEPEEAHVHMYTHISDIASVDWSKYTKLFVYNTSRYEKIEDVDDALKLHLPDAISICQNT